MQVIQAFGSVSSLAFGRSQVRFPSPALSVTDERMNTKPWLTAEVKPVQELSVKT